MLLAFGMKTQETYISSRRAFVLLKIQFLISKAMAHQTTMQLNAIVLTMIFLTGPRKAGEEHVDF